MSPLARAKGDSIRTAAIGNRNEVSAQRFFYLLDGFPVTIAGCSTGQRWGLATRSQTARERRIAKTLKAGFWSLLAARADMPALIDMPKGKSPECASATATFRACNKS